MGYRGHRTILAASLLLALASSASAGTTARAASAVEAIAAPPRKQYGKVRTKIRRALNAANYHAFKATVTVVGGAADRVGGMLQKRGEKMIAKREQSRTGRVMRRTGKIIELLAGTETLSHTSIELTSSIGASFSRFGRFGTVFNLSSNVGLWSGDLNYWKMVHNGELERDVHINYGVTAGTPVFAKGWSRLGRESTKIPGARYDKRSWGMAPGIPYLFSLGIGEVYADKPGQYARGPYLSSSTGTPLGVYGPGMLSLGFGIKLFYPPLEKPVQKLRVPIMGLQRWITGVAGKVSKGVKRTLHIGAKKNAEPKMTVESAPSS